MKVLLIGYGNPGRLDDGLGPALAEAIEKLEIPDVTVDANYQLTVEDASAIAEHDIVVFADAALDGTEPFFFKEILPKKDISFSSHSISPESVLGLAHDMFHGKTKGFALGIRGYEFDEFGQKISSKAQKNLEDAIVFITSLLREKKLQKNISQ